MCASLNCIIFVVAVNDINKHSTAAQAVNMMCDKISELAGLPVEKREAKKRKKLIAK